MAKKFQTLDIGASSVALAEYESTGSGLTLVNYGTAALAASLESGDADTILSPAILEIVREKGIKPGHVAVSLSGQMVFPRFAAIPFAGSDEAKFEQMVRYEIEQNIPFPIDEMVCDRQILGETENGDKAVMIVAAKVDQVEAITTALTSVGFSPDIVDVAPLAVMNALRSARPDEYNSCVVVLDIGAKTTSLVIAEGEKLYNRSIPVAGNTITKEISQSLRCTPEEAENIKRNGAYVSLGGVTEDEDPTLDRVSKVCRAVLTRLHAEISRSINFYRSQQGGGTPAKLYLTGGTTLLPHLDRFFAESLGIKVEYFNPFDSIAVGPMVKADALATDGAVLAATAGLACHEAGTASYTINLMPPSLIEARAEVKRIPFVAIGALAFVAAIACVFLSVEGKGRVVESRLEAASMKVSDLEGFKSKVDKAKKAEMQAETDADSLKKLVFQRGAAVARLNALRVALGSIGDSNRRGSDLWIDKWQDGKVTIRGWKDRVDAFVARASARGESGVASDIVAARLRANPIVESVNVSEQSEFGKDGCLMQFVVEIKFK